MEGGYIGREGITGQLAAIEQPVEELSRPRCLTGALSAFFRRVLGLIVLVSLCLFFRLARSGAYRVVNGFQAVLRHPFKHGFAVPRLQFGRYPCGHALLKLPVVLSEPGRELSRLRIEVFLRNSDTVPSTENRSCLWFGSTSGSRS